jgi:UMP-CMP kinase
MRYPLAASLLLILRSKAAAFNSFSSPLALRKASIGTAFIDMGRGKGSNKSRVPKRNLSATVSADEASVPSSGKSKDVVNAALSSRAITGESLSAEVFGGLPYVNTGELTSKKQHRVLFILGGPGAGKGTQSERIVDTYKCIHLSVGELLREERKRGDASPHAELIEKCLVAGQIVPVEISLNLVRNAMDEACGGSSSYGQPIFLVDGFPRNYDNLSGWTKNMPEYASVIGSLIYDCPIDVLEKRILSRAETSGRSDDNLESARKRFTTFQDQTMPVVQALEEVESMETKEDGLSKMHIQHIIGIGTIEEVWDATKAAMDGYVKNDVLTANSLLLQAISDKNVDQYVSLCSAEMLQVEDEEDNDGNLPSGEVFNKYEVHEVGTETYVSNATVTFQGGTKAIVTYDRRTEDNDGNIVSEMKESRVWSHGCNGWECIHFIRKPVSGL